MFVPGDSEGKLAKSKGAESDALVLDWEDAVLSSAKASARDVTRRALESRAEYPQAVIIRVNAVRTGLLEEDLRAVADCDADALMLPKCEGAAHLDLVGERINLPIIATVETPLGVVRAIETASHSDRVAGLMFGSEDYSTEMGIERTSGEPETMFARSTVVNAARAFGREAFDSPCMDYKDLDLLRATTAHGRRLGFTGRLAIHPKQPPVINEIYTPNEADVAAARKMLDEFEQTGMGVVGMEGQVVHLVCGAHDSLR